MGLEDAILVEADADSISIHTHVLTCIIYAQIYMSFSCHKSDYSQTYSMMLGNSQVKL